MKAIVIIEFDPDTVLQARLENMNPIWDNLTEEEQAAAIAENAETIGSAIEGELGWVEASGISVNSVLLPEDIKPNDSDLGASVRSLLT